MENLSFDSLELDLIISALRRYRVAIYNSSLCDLSDYSNICCLIDRLVNCK